MDQGIESGKTARLAYSVKSLALALEVSEHFLRRKINAGELRATRLGRRVVIRSTEVERYLTKNMD